MKAKFMNEQSTNRENLIESIWNIISPYIEYIEGNDIRMSPHLDMSTMIEIDKVKDIMGVDLEHFYKSDLEGLTDDELQELKLDLSNIKNLN